MKIKITRRFCLRPGLDVAPGDVVEVSRHEAREALALDRAELLDAEPVAPTPPHARPFTDESLSPLKRLTRGRR